MRSLDQEEGHFVSTTPRRESRALGSAALIAVTCLLLGGGAAAVTVNAVASSQSPNDSRARQVGPRDIVQPTSILSYGQ